MTPAQYRRLLNRINRTVAVGALRILRPATRNPAVQSLSPLAQDLFELVQPQREAARDLSLAYYASLSPVGTAPNVLVPAYSPGDTKIALARFDERWEQATGAPARKKVATAATAAMIRHTEQGGRETVLQASRRDRIRFARTDPQPPTCAFCLLAISRGPVYLSADVTSGGFRAHDFCTCVPVPVFDGQTDWPGRAQYEAAEAFYIENAAGAQGAQLKALRRAIRENGSPI